MQDCKREVEAIKKTLTEPSLEMKNLGKHMNYRWMHYQQNTGNEGQNLWSRRYNERNQEISQTK